MLLAEYLTSRKKAGKERWSGGGVCYEGVYMNQLQKGKISCLNYETL